MYMQNKKWKKCSSRPQLGGKCSKSKKVKMYAMSPRTKENVRRAERRKKKNPKSLTPNRNHPQPAPESQPH